MKEDAHQEFLYRNLLILKTQRPKSKAKMFIDEYEPGVAVGDVRGSHMLGTARQLDKPNSIRV